MQKVAERFGEGDFSARIGSRRKDELGKLARALDAMAARIQTLLAAERRLLADISHELRSPLARLGVAVELARSGPNPAAALDRIQKESDRLNSLVGELLQVTRAEGDPSARRSEPVSLDALLGSIIDDAQVEAGARGCAVHFSETAAVTAPGDPELLRRAAENVIRNAVRYTPQGTSVQVALHADDGRARISVRDFGPGVPEEALPQIFNPFYRVESGRDRASGGVGLGLAIAKRAVELHGGTVSARNADPGLLVEITLPRSRET
jgi:two-component system sensor histidine kinase CpxA